MTTTIVNYCFNGEYYHEATTNLTPKEWLKEHNKERIASGNEPEEMFEFEFITLESEAK